MNTSTSQVSITKEQLAPFFQETKAKADQFMNYYMIGNFVFGLFLALFYSTWLIAIAVGGLSIIMYYVSKMILPKSTLYQFVASAVTAIFMAQFIYQMHGLFEMHFIVFVASLVLVAYHDWRLQLPLIVLVVVHHASFAYLQYSGVKDVYFTQLDYMTLKAFLFHGALASLIVFLSGYWSYQFRQQTIRSAQEAITRGVQLSRMSRNISFAEELIKGNLNAVLEVSEDDELGKSMLNMKTELNKSYERERQDKFLNTGLAEVGDILRSNMNNAQQMYDQLIAKLIKILNANQGGLYILEGEADNDPHLKLKSHYAYERKKFHEQRVEIGNGLLGQTFLERKTCYLTNVPQNYTTVTSGLGQATPNTLLIVPLIYNDDIVGVVEIASFAAFKDFEILFVEKVGEGIASTILTVKNNEQTHSLLENTRIQTEKLKQQEEEMRQNLEELAATQEEMSRKEAELHNRLIESQKNEAKLKEALSLLRNEPHLVNESGGI